MLGYGIFAVAVMALVLVVAGGCVSFYDSLHAQPLPAKLYAPMPRQIDVMGVQWRVEEVRFPEAAMQGYTECQKHVILLSTSGVHPRQTLIHELLHAATCHYNEKDKDFEPANLWYNSKSNEEHEGFNNIAGVISELLARNPQLAQWESEGSTISLGKVDIK